MTVTATVTSTLSYTTTRTLASTVTSTAPAPECPPLPRRPLVETYAAPIDQAADITVTYELSPPPVLATNPVPGETPEESLLQISENEILNQLLYSIQAQEDETEEEEKVPPAEVTITLATGLESDKLEAQADYALPLNSAAVIEPSSSASSTSSSDTSLLLQSEQISQLALPNSEEDSIYFPSTSSASISLAQSTESDSTLIYDPVPAGNILWAY